MYLEDEAESSLLNNDISLPEKMDMPDPHFPIKLHQIEWKKPDSLLFPPHWHEHLEFLYVVSGTMEVACGSTIIQAVPGDMVVINSNELHQGMCLSPDLFYYALIAHPSILHSSSADAAETKFIVPIAQNRLIIRNHIRNNDSVNACMLSIVQEMKAKGFGYELAIKSELYRLLTLLLRSHVETVLTKDEFDERMKNVKRFEPVFRYIEQHYMEELPVEELAAIASLSRYHFSRLFKELSGRTITEYITAIRLNKADYLLRNTGQTVSEIASACGFNDIYYFSKTFKKYKHLAPSELRRGI
ncbi:AraC family transcriptional regulator [Paenibacillus sp. J5C_2022]|uniref:AraC family transcriptional regulator n=1 Tax=Paenibacillus sp. J5C2022 TaxID=2977129 RepID=UPI0021D1DA5E|nr:AraC family transcriptional regulator [Paenibacillus sp. J5C2022]MCU6712678.1 AraC family transcriptional regulator [Paenibacillus sp. J5C2022]